MKGIIDRIENGFAVVETEDGFVNIPLSECSGASEGDCVVVEDGVVTGIDKAETLQRTERISSLMNKLFKSDK